MTRSTRTKTRAVAHVAAWLAETFGGPRRYTEEMGGYEHMLAKHRNLQLTEEQRRRWVGRIAEAADEAGLPDDPDFRSAFVAYIDWGTRIAVDNSRPDAAPPSKRPYPGGVGVRAHPTFQRLRGDRPSHGRRYTCT